jgi:hypothetical protein
MKDIYSVLLNIKENPVVYLGRYSIVALKGFLEGYNTARRELGLPLTNEEQEFDKFQQWVKENAKIKSDKSWDKIILLYSEDEAQALDKFFVNLEIFKKQNQSSESPEKTG